MVRSMLLGVWVLSTVYMAGHLNRGWVPHDEGALAQSAERVLHGELPHRDFDEIYTGGLSFLNALAFQVLGTNLASLRVVLFVCFLAWVPVVYWIAARFTSPVAAGGITLLSVAWSVPNYAAAVPSWYNLFFATFGTAALLKYLQSPSRRWLFTAGICGGLSFLAKVSGLYFVAAALLFFVFREQCLTLAQPGEALKRARVYPVFVMAGLLLFIFVLLTMINTGSSTSFGFLHLVLPGVILASLLLWRESRAPIGTDRKRFAEVFWMLLPLGAGVLLPIAIFMIPYARSGDVPAFINGVFLLPAKRFGFAAGINSGTFAPITALPLVAVLGAAMYWRTRVPMVVNILVALGLGLVLVASERYMPVYRFALYALVMLTPLTVLAGAVLLKDSRGAAGLSVLHQQQVMLLLCVAGMCNLVRFPYDASIYFCYVAPLLALALLAVFSTRGQAPRFVLASMVLFYLLFAVLRVTPGFIYAMGLGYQSDPMTQRLALPRAGGLRVNPYAARQYELLIPLLHEHAAGTFIYAAPDCPEVYFLSGLRNPTRTLFDFFDEPAGRTERILGALQTHQVNEIAIFSSPWFSGPLAPDLRAALQERYPRAATVGQFEVRWRP